MSDKNKKRKAEPKVKKTEKKLKSRNWTQEEMLLLAILADPDEGFVNMLEKKCSRERQTRRSLRPLWPSFRKSFTLLNSFSESKKGTFLEK